jgi:hypothetical protein
LVEVVAAQGEGGFFCEHAPNDVPVIVNPEPAGTVAWNDPTACVVPSGASLPTFRVNDRVPAPTEAGLRTAQYVLFATDWGHAPADADTGPNPNVIAPRAAASPIASSRERLIPLPPFPSPESEHRLAADGVHDRAD